MWSCPLPSSFVDQKALILSCDSSHPRLHFLRCRYCSDTTCQEWNRALDGEVAVYSRQVRAVAGGT
jgi:hypothetical protein